ARADRMILSSEGDSYLWRIGYPALKGWAIFFPGVVVVLNAHESSVRSAGLFYRRSGEIRNYASGCAARQSPGAFSLAGGNGVLSDGSKEIRKRRSAGAVCLSNKTIVLPRFVLWCIEVARTLI